MTNPLKALSPLELIKSTRDWFVKVEKSSGFRPFLIFLLFCFTLVLLLLPYFPDRVDRICIVALGAGLPMVWYMILGAVKSFQDPNFCRSEVHVENLRKLELMEQKGDLSPQVIDLSESKPERKRRKQGRLPSKDSSGNQSAEQEEGK